MHGQQEISHIQAGLSTKIMLVLALSGLCSSAFAQDFADGMSESILDTFASESKGSPTNDLSGHEKGDRTALEAVDETTDDTDEAEAIEWFGSASWWEWSRMTGNWGGVRSDIENAGITIEGALVTDWFSVVSGGVDEDSEWMSLFDVNINFDLDEIFGLKGGAVFVDYYTTGDQSISGHAGDIQGLSNIETGDHISEIAELWYEQWLFDDKLRLKIGKVDGNSEFAYVDAAGEFLNSSAGFSPTILAMTTFPDPAMSINVFVYPTDNVYVGFGIYDGAGAVDGVATGGRGPSTFFNDDLSDDYMYMLESGFTWESFAGGGPGRFAAGLWHHDGEFTTFAAGTANGTTGFYALVEHQLWSPDSAGSESERGLTGFLQYGYGDADVSEIEHHVGIGFVLQGTFSGRDDDATGIYLSLASLSEEAGFTDDELTIELFYKIQLTPAISIKPDVQWISNPSGSSTVDDAVVAGIRAEFVF